MAPITVQWANNEKSNIVVQLMVDCVISTFLSIIHPMRITDIFFFSSSSFSRMTNNTREILLDIVRNYCCYYYYYNFNNFVTMIRKKLTLKNTLFLKFQGKK